MRWENSLIVSKEHENGRFHESLSQFSLWFSTDVGLVESAQSLENLFLAESVICGKNLGW